MSGNHQVVSNDELLVDDLYRGWLDGDTHFCHIRTGSAGKTWCGIEAPRLHPTTLRWHGAAERPARCSCGNAWCPDCVYASERP